MLLLNSLSKTAGRGLWWWKFFAILSFFAAAAAFYHGHTKLQEVSTVSERFGVIRTFLGSGDPKRAYLIFASAADWDGSVSEIARGLAATGDLVIGVNETSYRRQLAADDGTCLFIAGEIQRLSQSVQNGLKLKRYLYPILIGYGDGASLAYAALAQHPEPVFGGILINFSGTYPSKTNFCPGDYLHAEQAQPNLVKFSSNPDLPITAVGITLPRCANISVDDLFTEPPSKMPMSTDAASTPECGQALFAAIRAVQPDSDLPDAVAATVSDAENAVVELLPEKPGSDFFVLFLSGDGGWATIDKKLGEDLQSRGVPVIGFDSLDYFWQRKTQEQAGRDVVAIIEKYRAELKMDRFAIVGFSMGADVLPFILDELPLKFRRRLAGVALLSPSLTAAFEVHISDWIGIDEAADEKPILPELKELDALNIACYYGEDEADDSLCTSGSPKLDRVVKFPGGHHFDEHYDEIAEDLFTFLSGRSPAAGGPAVSSPEPVPSPAESPAAAPIDSVTK